MNNIVATIKEEWERSILVFLILVLVVGVGYGAYVYLNREEESEGTRKSKPELPYYYDTALLKPGSLPAWKKGINPMSCVFEKPAPPKPKPRPFQRKPKPIVKEPASAKPVPGKSAPSPSAPSKPKAAQGKTAKKPVQPSRPAAQRQVPMKASAKPITPPKPKRKRSFDFHYVGNMSISGGSSGAQLYVSEHISPRQRNRFKARLHDGEALFSGLFKVVSFDKYKVVLEYQGGKRLEVPMGNQRSIQLEVVD